MNAQVTPFPKGPPSSTPRPPRVVSGRDREFLPAALEILETPPPPLPLALIGTICLVALAALVWSFIGRLDVHAVAPGKIETAGHSKVIEPLEPGKVAAIHVEAGQSVKTGDLLFELDPAEANADALAARDARDASLAEIARRRYAIDAVRVAQTEEKRSENRAAARVEKIADDGSRAAVVSPIEELALGPDLKIIWDQSLAGSFRLREEAVLHADLGQLSDSLKALDKQMAQKLATQKRLSMSIAFQHTLMDTLNHLVSTRQQAIDLNVGTKINLYNAKVELERSQAQLASDEGQLIETDAALEELQSEKAKTVSQFLADNQNKVAEASRKADEARQALAKADARLARTKLQAPIDGVVQQTAVTTIGQVVTTGQQLAVITPTGGKLQVEALVANLDIGFVKPGQHAVIKVDAFPFTRFGVLNGQVITIAPSAVTEQEAKRAMANATAVANAAPQAPLAAPGQPESFVFPVTIELDDSAMKTDIALAQLSPGMTVMVEIKTDSRRVIDYLISPLVKIASEAAKER
jgi:hemolysin D